MKPSLRIPLVACLMTITLTSTACGTHPAISTPTTQAKLVETTAPALVVLPTASPIIQPTPGGDEANSPVIKALLSLTTQPNLMDITTVLSDGTTQVTSIEFVPPDKKHILDVNSGVEYLIAGGKVYSRSSPMGEWAITQMAASSFLGDQPTTSQSIADSISNVQVLRKDTFDGKPVTIYSYDSTTTSNGQDLKSHNELWVGEADGYPHKLVANGAILSASTEPNSGESRLSPVQAQTTTMITFDPSINIEAPNP
jgi:hypothetical protein